MQTGSAEDIQISFGSTDLLGKGTERVVFDIGGNNYLVICKYALVGRRIYLFVGSEHMLNTRGM